MPVKKRYYWLKLHRDFFKRHDIQIIEAMDNGKDYILFYLKLLAESVDHDGELRFSNEIPYDEKMLSVITNTNIDTVRFAVSAFAQCGMMEKWDDGTYFMSKIDMMIGSETDSASRVRRCRDRKALQCNTDVTNSNGIEINGNKNANTELELELELEKENKEKNTKKENPQPPTNWDDDEPAIQPIPPQIKPAQDPIQESASELITQIINHWNGKSNLPNCRYQSFSIPGISDFTAKLSVFSLSEIIKSIDNLSDLWDKIEPKYRPRTLSKFILKVDEWTDEARPGDRYKKTKEKKDQIITDFEPTEEVNQIWKR